MKRSSCLVVILMVFSGIRSAGFHEVEVAPVRVSDPAGARRDPRVDVLKLGVHSLGNAAYELALQRAQLRAGQAKGLIDKVNAKIRLTLGLPPKPETLVAGKFLEDGLTVAEKEALDHLSQHTFTLHPVDTQVVPMQEVISKEAIRIGIVKARLNTVLADKANYSSSARIDELVKEVEGLYKVLDKAIDQEATNFKVQYPDVTRDEDYENNLSYLNTIQQGLDALKNLQRIQTDFPSLKSTWFSRLFGVSSKSIGSIKAGKLYPDGVTRDGNLDPHIYLPKYLFLEIPGQAQLQAMVREKAFELCKNLFLKEYSPKRPAMKAKVLQFFNDYRSYQQGGVGRARIETEIKEITAPSVVVPSQTVQPFPVYKPVDNAPTVTSLQTMSDLLASGKDKQTVEVAFARLLRPPFSSSEKEHIDDALDASGSLSLDTTVAFQKGPGTLVDALGRLHDSIQDTKGDAAIKKDVASLSAVAQKSLVDLQTLFEQQGIAHEMTFVISYYKTALQAADDEYQGSHDASAYLKEVLYARSVFESAYKEAVQKPAVEFVLWKNRLQKLLDSRIQALKPVEAPVVEPISVVSDPDIPLHPAVVEKQQELALAKQKKDAEDRVKQQEIQTALAPLGLQEKADSITSAVKSFQELLQKDPFDAQDLEAVVARYEHLTLAIDDFVINDRAEFDKIKKDYSNNDHAAGRAFSPYATLFNRVGLALNQYSSVVREMQNVQQLFHDFTTVLSARKASIDVIKQLINRYDVQVLERYSKFSNVQLKGFSEYVSKKATDLVNEMKERGLYPKEPEPSVKPIPVVRAPLTDKVVAQRMAELEGVGVEITNYKNGFEAQVRSIDALLAKQEADFDDVSQKYETFFDDLSKEYETLQKGLKQYWDLSNELHRVSSSGLDQLLGGLGRKQGELGNELRAIYRAYSQKVTELQNLGIGKLSEVTQTFALVEKALEPGVTETPSLVQKLKGLVVKKAPKLSPDLVSKLCELVFFEAPSSLVLQKGVRKTAMEYLGRGLPKDQIDDMKNFYGDLVAYRRAVSEVVVSKVPEDMEQLENRLEALKEKVEKSKIPQRFKTLVSLRIIDELRKVTMVSFPIEYIKEEIGTIRQQLLEVIAGKEELQEFRTRNSRSVRDLLKKPANSVETTAQLQQILNFMGEDDGAGKLLSGEVKTTDSRYVFSKAISDLDQARFAISHRATAEMLARAATRLGADIAPEVFDFKTSLSPLLRLLFFKQPGYDWARDSIQDEAFTVLDSAVTTEGILTPEQKTVIEKVLADYQTFKNGHDQIQALVGAKQITVSQQAALKVLESSIQDSIQRVIKQYPNTHQATVDNPEAPDYVQTNFKLPILAGLRADAAQIPLVEAEIKVGKIEVVPDPLPLDDHLVPRPEHKDDDSDAGSFYSAEEGAEERDKDFEEALPEAVQEQVTLAMKSIAQLKTLAAQFSVHAKSVDSIGLAEEGLAIVTAFEGRMPENILDHDEGALRGHIDALKLLFNDAMNNQKLAVVASLQALRASVAHEFGATVFPPATAGFKAQVVQILTPHFEDSLSEGSAFKKFVVEAQGSLDSTAETKGFFTLLDQEQATLKEKETDYAQALGKVQDKDVLAALADYPKQGVLAATEVIIPKLEDAYRLALFDTLTGPQQDAFKGHNPELYEQLAKEVALKKEGEAFKKQAQELSEQFNKYIKETYFSRFDKITVEQASELLGGKDGSGGVQKQLDYYYHFMSQLRLSNNVDLAFELYYKLDPLYEKLNKIKDYFKDLKSSKIRDTISFWKELDIRAKSPLWDAPPFHENYELEKFFSNPLVYLRDQGEQAQGEITSLTRVGGVANLSDLLTEARDRKRRSEEKTISAMRLASLKSNVESLEKLYNQIKDAYGERKAAVDSALQLGVPGDAPLSFEEKLQSPEGRQQTVEFMAQALSVPGSVYVPPFAFFDVPRETLQARLIATGKTTSAEEDHRYRDLDIVVRNDLLWNIELEKLQGKSVLIPEEVKEKMVEWATKSQKDFAPEPTAMSLISTVLEEIKAELASKVAVR